VSAICQWVDTLIQENSDLKLKLDENFNATKNIIDAFSNFQLQNKGKCKNQREKCEETEKKLEDLILEIDECKLDYKSA